MAEPFVRAVFGPTLGQQPISTSVRLGDPVYWDSANSVWEQANATDETKPPRWICVGGASIGTGRRGALAKGALIEDSDAPFAVDTIYYLSATITDSAILTATRPATAGNVAVELGRGLTTSTVLVRIPMEADFGGTVYAESGTAGAPSHSFSTDPDVGLYRIGANRLGIATNGALGVEVGAAGQLLLTPNALSATVGTTGAFLNQAAQTLTDNATAMSGTLNLGVVNAFQQPTLAASNTSVTTTIAATVYVAGAPLAGTNETLTNRAAVAVLAETGVWAYSIVNADGTSVLQLTANGSSGAIITAPDGLSFRLGGGAGTERIGINPGGALPYFAFAPANQSAAPSATGRHFNVAAATYTDNSTAMSGTATIVAINSFQTPTIAASNTSVTTTDVANLYVSAAPTAGTNQTFTRSYSLLLDAGQFRVDSNVQVNNTAAFATTEPTAATVYQNGTAPAGAITTGGAVFTDGTNMRKIIAAGTVSNIET